MKNQEFVDYIIHDTLAGVSGIRSRKIFSSTGLYLNGVIWGIVHEGELYVKDSPAVRALVGTDTRNFTYSRESKTVTLSYIAIPGELLEDRGVLCEIVDAAVDARKSDKLQRRK